MAKTAWKRGFIGNSQERKMAPISLRNAFGSIIDPKLRVFFFPNRALIIIVYLGMILKPIFPSFLVLALAIVSSPSHAQLEASPQPIPLGHETGSLAFERSELTFAPQSTGIENCVNVAIDNTTDHPRLLSELRSLDPRHFYVTSPTKEMMPLTIGANSTFYLNLCFKADEVKDYTTRVLAIFQGDTVPLKISGRGVEPPAIVPVPSETGITNVKSKKHVWTFQFGLKTRGTIKLTLEDVMSKTVRNFPFDGVKAPGYYETTFDEKSDAGKKLAKGDYILRLEVTDQKAKTSAHSSKLVKIK